MKTIGKKSKLLQMPPKTEIWRPIYGGPTTVVWRTSKPKPKPVKESCSRCGKIYPTKEMCREHKKNKPKFCKKHTICHNSWHEHVNQHSHTKCPLDREGCPRAKAGVDYGSDMAFMDHFRRRHG